MSLKNDKIECPNCGHEFDVEEALSGNIQKHFQKEYEKRVAENANHYKEKAKELEDREKIFEDKKAKQNEIFKKQLASKLEEKEQDIKKETEEKFEAKLKALEEENEKKKKENRELRELEVRLMQREKALKEERENLELELQKKMLEKQSSIEEEAKKKSLEEFKLREMEWGKKFEDQSKLIDEMKRKAEQGSMQMQGEILELALEELLKKQFPFDKVEEVPKGISGADVIQKVINERQEFCGTIVYESKRTKNFDHKWIDKLKQDQIRVKGDLAVLVTQTLPKNLDRFDNVENVWVCTFSEVASLSKVLRELLIQTQAVKDVQENKGDKMELLYSYLTSNDFVQKVKRVIETYDGMRNQLESEKKAMTKIWSTREKQIWVVQENLSQLLGDIKGIGGNALPNLSVLELQKPDDD